MQQIQTNNMTKHLTSIQIAATYIGTIIGAGFASGQEILQFFGYLGVRGLLAVGITSLLFMGFGFAILHIGHRLQATSHLQVIRFSGGNWIGTVVDSVITFFLFGALTVMAAGAGALFAQEFGLPAIVGGLIMMLATLVTVLRGIRGIVSAMSYLAPFLLLSVLGLGLTTVAINWGKLAENIGWSMTEAAPVPNWIISAINYTSYNLVVGVAVLAPMGGIANQKAISGGAILGGLGLGLGALTITLSILANVPEAIRYPIPMLFVAQLLSPALGYGYGIVLLLSIFTTAVSSLYGFASRLTDPGGPHFRRLVIAASAVAFLGSQVGFTTLVGTLFPAVGYAGLLLLGSLVFGMFKLNYRSGLAESQPEPVLPASLKPLLDSDPSDKNISTVLAGETPGHKNLSTFTAGDKSPED
ncbi:MAG: hypothetical protein KGZ75_03650 [Syntrophomonadaceae bacterium]|nr:hypothetical protein [Syntrophomonadaceae bacterium]